MGNFTGKRILVTGGTSMIGGCAATLLEKEDATVDRVPHQECDILNLSEINNRIDRFKPDYVIHAGGFNGGLNFNKAYPADIYYQNAQMALNILNACHTHNVSKVISILPSCAYSAFDEKGWTKELLSESEFGDGPPHPSVECHGLAKRILFSYSKQLFKQYQRNYVCVILNNCYGPKDSFDLDKTKVVGALIKKFVDAKRSGAASVEVFGTGAARREFLYAEDAADGIITALEKYNDPNTPINIGSGSDISIRELAELLKKITQYTGQIKYLGEYGDGQLRKLLDITRTIEFLDWRPKTSLEVGLTKTVQWYEENYK